MVETSSSSGLWPSLYQPLLRAGAQLGEWLSPASEASSNDSAYHIAVELPGVAEEDITLDFHDGLITLSGEKRQEREEQGETWYFRERNYGSFARSFRLPADADGDNAKATLKDGVLSVAVPKLPADAGKKKLKIRKG